MFLRTRLPELRRSRSVSDVRRRRPKEWQARAVVTTCAMILALADAGPQGGVRAQQAPTGAPPAAGQPTFRTEANFILTDVFVTKDGKPVTDLKVEDFELKEDGALQAIKSFEYVHITRGMTSGRRDPSTVAESAAAVSDPKRRVFVLFLDTFHVTRASSMVVRKNLMTFVQSMLGPDDLIALVTPQMGGSDLSFTSSPQSILGYFTNNPVWGVADELPGAESDEVEKNLSGCVNPNNLGDWIKLRGRLREKRTFQAMRDMVRYLDGLRESRKAIVMVSEGWSLFRANERVLTDSSQPNRPPGRPVIGVGPDGRIGDQTGRNRTGGSEYACDTLRAELSNLDTSDQFRTEIIGEANRANASYYTFDPRGLRAESQTPVLSNDPVVGLAQMRNPDREFFSTPLQTLKTLGPATNGLAIVDSNDFSGGLTRVIDDFNSFYLLGYNSSNSRLDGKYRKISVKVKRPGVEVRSREGYTAGFPGSTRAAPGGGPAAAPPSDAETMVTAALSRIAPSRAGVPFLLYAAAGGAGPEAIVRVVAELEGALVQTPDWREGGEATVTVRNGAGATLGSAVSKFAPGERIIRIDVPMTEAASGDLRVQVRVTGTGALARFTDATNVKVDAVTPHWGAPLVLRRGPTTGTAYVPTADLRFRRQERVRVELPSPRDSVTAALVDRRGKPMEIPVRVDAATPDHALTADVSLAPLAAGDYAIVLTVGEIHLAVPIRVIP